MKSFLCSDILVPSAAPVWRHDFAGMAKIFRSALGQEQTS